MVQLKKHAGILRTELDRRNIYPSAAASEVRLDLTVLTEHGFAMSPLARRYQLLSQRSKQEAAYEAP